MIAVSVRDHEPFRLDTNIFDPRERRVRRRRESGIEQRRGPINERERAVSLSARLVETYDRTRRLTSTAGLSDGEDSVEHVVGDDPRGRPTADVVILVEGGFEPR